LVEQDDEIDNSTEKTFDSSIKRVVKINEDYNEDNYNNQLVEENLISIKELNLHSNFIKNGIIEINRKGDNIIDYKLYEATDNGRTQITFDILGNNGHIVDNSINGNDNIKSLHYNKFNDVDYKIVYNE
jgi:hypothetical protein